MRKTVTDKRRAQCVLEPNDLSTHATPHPRSRGLIEQCDYRGARPDRTPTIRHTRLRFRSHT
eukprot:8553404-Alexandrium_andersonii.AAC.1